MYLCVRVRACVSVCMCVCMCVYLCTRAVTGDDEVWGIDFDTQLVQRCAYVLPRSPVLDSLVSGMKPSKTSNGDWVML